MAATKLGLAGCCCIGHGEGLAVQVIACCDATGATATIRDSGGAVVHAPLSQGSYTLTYSESAGCWGSSTAFTWPLPAGQGTIFIRLPPKQIKVTRRGTCGYSRYDYPISFVAETTITLGGIYSGSCTIPTAGGDGSCTISLPDPGGASGPVTVTASSDRFQTTTVSIDTSGMYPCSAEVLLEIDHSCYTCCICGNPVGLEYEVETPLGTFTFPWNGGSVTVNCDGTDILGVFGCGESDVEHYGFAPYFIWYHFPVPCDSSAARVTWDDTGPARCFPYRFTGSIGPETARCPPACVQGAYTCTEVACGGGGAMPGRFAVTSPYAAPTPTASPSPKRARWNAS